MINSSRPIDKINKSNLLQEIFESQDSDEVIETIMIEMNKILEHLSPSRVVKCKADNEPWKNRETKETLDEANEQLAKAIEYNTIEEWRLSRITRNVASKFLEVAKKNYFVARLGSSRTVWQELKKLKSNDEIGPPTKIINNNKGVTSPEKMSKIFNEFFRGEYSSINLIILPIHIQ